MENKIKNMTQPTGINKPEIAKEQEIVKAAHLSSRTINVQSNNGSAHFEVEVENAFFRIFFGC